MSSSNSTSIEAHHVHYIIGIQFPFDVDGKIMAVFLLGIPPITTSFHICLIYLLFISKRRKNYTNIFYKLVMTISIVVIYWGGYFMYQGLCQLLGRYPFGEFANILIATIAQYLFYVCMNMNLLIAVNRFSAVVLCNMYEEIFTPVKGVLYVLVIMVISALENIPGFVFLMKYYLDRKTFSYLIEPSENIQKLVIFAEMGFTYLVHAAIFTLYGWSFYTYKRKVNLSTNHKKERRLLIQAVISGSPCFVLMTFHHMVHFPFFEVLAGELCIGIDPIVYLWFNSEIRNDFLEMIGMKEVMKKFKRQRIYTSSQGNLSFGMNTAHTQESTTK